jgi:cellulose biosynthesis protein BcsQ
VPASVITVVNMKGGVGKTTTVIGLAETLAAIDDARVLVVDLDAQANASYSIVGDEVLTDLIHSNRTVDAYFHACLIQNRPIPIMDLVHHNASSITHQSEDSLPISLLASSVNLRLTEREIVYHLTREGCDMDAIEGQAADQMDVDLASISDDFDFIIVDCAPGISAFTAAAVSLADLIIVPTIPDFLSTYGMQSFVRRVFPELIAGSDSRHKPHVLISRKRAMKEQHAYHSLLRQYAERKEAEFRLFQTYIPDNPAFSSAAGKYHNTYLRKYPMPLSGCFEAFANEVKAVLK